MTIVYLSLLLLSSTALLGAFWWWRRRRAPAPREVSWEQVEAAAASGGYKLISTVEMADRYLRNHQSLLLVDTREPAEYLGGHILGAVNLPLTPTWWGRWRSRRPLAQLMGPDKERLVVFY